MHHIRDNEKGTCMLIGVKIWDRNVIKKGADKIIIKKTLTVKLQPVCKAKTNVIPLIITATEIISKSFKGHISHIPR
jgi:hypothetical protein